MEHLQGMNILLSQSEDRLMLVSDLHAKIYPTELGFIKDKKVAIISPRSILKFVDEELIHDNMAIVELAGQTLSTMSSGERKKAFFNYTLSLKPEVLILDHFLDALDIVARSTFAEKLKKINHTTLIINIYSRQEDSMLFLNQTVHYQDGKFINTTATQVNNQTSQPTDNLTPIPAPPKAVDLPTGSLIVFKNVTICYHDKPILKDINWQVNAGEFWHLHGPNGSGKTTLLTMITGDNPKAYGQDIWLFGQKKGSGETIWDIKRKVGYFTSNMTFQFWRMQNLQDMITSGFYDSIGLYVVPSDHQVFLANQWLAYIGLSQYANKPFVKLSLCHQRMVMIARAMVKHPPLLILDEPSVDLDEESAHLMTNLINRIAQESQTTLIYVSHRMEPGLSPTHSYELKPTPTGSTGIARNIAEHKCK